MQEEYAHLIKAWHVIRLYDRGETADTQKEWISPKKRLPTCTSQCKVLAKFFDESVEEVYFIERLPHWWYVAPKGCNGPVIHKEIKEWKGL